MMYYAIYKATDGGYYVKSTAPFGQVSVDGGTRLASDLEGCLAYVLKKLKEQAEKP
jgi:hypothetical protein